MKQIKRQGRRWIPLVLIALIIGAIGVLMQTASSRAAHCIGTTATEQGTCTENVFETKHNLAANTDILATGTTEVCVFCHTPHGGQSQQVNQSGGAPAPLWNRALPNSSGWTMYNSPNTDVAPGSAPLGVSLACLSCHDGTIALDALINAPGSGGLRSGNRGEIASGGGITGITFQGPGVQGTGDGPNDGQLKGALRPSTDEDNDRYTGGLDDFVNPGTGEGMSPFPNLTRDLSDDHPISIRMPSTDPQFNDALDSEIPTDSPNIRPIYRNTVSNGPQIIPGDKRDRIRLYDTAGLSGVNKDAVECASCHNPHTPRTTFLRLPSITATQGGPADGTESPAGGSRNLNHEPNQGSLICLTCHQK